MKLKRRIIDRPSDLTVRRAQIIGQKAGRAGLIASIAMALVGVFLGAGASYLTGQNNEASARHAGFRDLGAARDRAVLMSDTPIAAGRLREGRSFQGFLPDSQARDLIVEQVLSTLKSEGEEVDLKSNKQLISQPRVVIVFDDMGLDRRVFDDVMDLPGPLTLSFLPYGKNVQEMADDAAEHGYGVMLHLPMEPVGAADPGPHALNVGASAKFLNSELGWNLNRFSGFTGVNNHMGSKFTTNREGMAVVLNMLEARDLYFLDSMTTAQSVGQEMAHQTGTRLVRRDVFLDPEAGKETVYRQLQQVEEIALRTGYVIAIAHPHQDTLNVIGPWLTSALLRGFELVTLDELINEKQSGHKETVVQSEL